MVDNKENKPKSIKETFDFDFTCISLENVSKEKETEGEYQIITTNQFEFDFSADKFFDENEVMVIKAEKGGKPEKEIDEGNDRAS